MELRLRVPIPLFYRYLNVLDMFDAANLHWRISIHFIRKAFFLVGVELSRILGFGLFETLG